MSRRKGMCRSARRLQVSPLDGRKVLLKLGHESDIGLPPLAMAQPQILCNLPFQNRIGPAALQLLHLMVMLEVEIGEGADCVPQKRVQIEAPVRADDQTVKRRHSMVLVRHVSTLLFVCLSFMLRQGGEMHVELRSSRKSTCNELV